MKNIKHYLKAFTLVELIIVITILAILATIAFVSFQNYTKDARDSNRLATLKNIENGLNAFQITTGNYPEPDTPIQVLSSGTLLTTQGTIGQTVSQLIKLSKTPTDPTDQIPFVYTTNNNKLKYQLLSYLENSNQLTTLKQTYALDYTQRTPKTLGNTLGVILNGDNSLLNSSIDLQGSNSGIVYKTLFSNQDIVSFSGYALSSMMYSRQGDAPKDCPEGFIPVPGNAEFNTSGGFCVAKYEMGYADELVPNTCDDGADPGDGCSGVIVNNNTSTAYYSDRNSVKYTPGKKIFSIPGVYPIADITQQQSIDACKSMGVGYHLITNNEWMTIARNIEAHKLNWMNNEVGTSKLHKMINLPICNLRYGNTESRTYATTTGPGENSQCDIKRKNILTNGLEIWDLAGNLREHVNKSNTLDGTKYNQGTTSITGSTNGTNWDDDGVYDMNDMKKFASAFLLGQGNGMGNIYYGNGNGGNIFFRGGSISSEGIFTLGLVWTWGNMYRHTGFRCAYIK